MKEGQQQQQQQQQPLNSAVADGIERLEDPVYREEIHKLVVNGFYERPVDRQSLQHLVDFLDNVASHEVVITALWLHNVTLISDPSDGGLNILRDFLARSDTTLTNVTMDGCDFGSQEHASQLLTAFHTNRTVTDIKIYIESKIWKEAFSLALVFLV
jgi:hypothetical protein